MSPSFVVSSEGGHMINYTKNDMRVLFNLSVDGSIPKSFLPELNFSPKAFKQLLESYGLKKDVTYLFEMPLKNVGLLINEGNVSGYLKFRLQVGK